RGASVVRDHPRLGREAEAGPSFRGTTASTGASPGLGGGAGRGLARGPSALRLLGLAAASARRRRVGRRGLLGRLLGRPRRAPGVGLPRDPEHVAQLARERAAGEVL